MRNRFVGLMVLAIVVVGVVEAGSQEVTHDAAYRQAREQMADLLVSEEFEKVEISAASFDGAMALIYTAVDTYLDQSLPDLGDVETAREYGVDVLQGLNDHKIRYAGDSGYALAGKRRILISSDEDAKDLGELVARVAMMIHGGRKRVSIDTRSAARKIFEGMLPVEGTGQPLVTQYVVRLRMMSKTDRKEILKYALE